jgi:hypothetical protein
MRFTASPSQLEKGEKWKLAKSERIWEWKVAVYLFMAAMVFVGLSSPIFMMLFRPYLGNWFEWTEGFLGRLATSALVSSIVSLFTVMLHYQDLKRFGAVRWQLKQEGPVQTI